MHLWSQGILFQTSRVRSPNIGHEKLWLQWLNSPYHSCTGPIPLTKVSFDSLITSDVDGPNFTACVLCAVPVWRVIFSMTKVPNIIYEEPLFQWSEFLILIIKGPYFMVKNPHIPYEATLLQWSKFPYFSSKDDAVPTGWGEGMRHCTITISILKFWNLKLKIVRNVLEDFRGATEPVHIHSAFWFNQLFSEI